MLGCFVVELFNGTPIQIPELEGGVDLESKHRLCLSFPLPLLHSYYGWLHEIHFNVMDCVDFRHDFSDTVLFWIFGVIFWGVGVTDRFCPDYPEIGFPLMPVWLRPPLILGIGSRKRRGYATGAYINVNHLIKLYSHQEVKMKTATILVKGVDTEFTFAELQELEDAINEAQGGILADFGDSASLEQFALKRKYSERIGEFGKSETLLDWLRK